MDDHTGFGDLIESLAEIIAQLDARVSVSFARRFTETVHSHSARQPQPLGGRPSSLAILRGDRSRSFSTIGAYRKWCNHADSVGFPVGGMQMVLGVDATHLHVFTSTFVLGRVLGWDTPVPVEAVVLAPIFSAAVGVFFGLYPARLASRLDP